MRFIEYIKSHFLGWLYIALILTFGFMYFIVYRTDSRIAWYNEMHTQSEDMIKEFKDVMGIK